LSIDEGESMPVRIGQRGDHGFDEPLGLLSDCHRRIEQFLRVLATTAAVHRGGELPPADRSALEGALRYFETAAPRHSADEEESLFPRLRTAADPEAQAALDTLARLESDHAAANRLHAEVHALGTRWLADGRLTAEEARALSGHLAELDRLYRTHIAVEDRELFPAAGRVLSAGDLAEVGREMAARRGVPFEPPSALGKTR
jgi:hemerythrin-like domain-containing protein